MLSTAARHGTDAARPLACCLQGLQRCWLHTGSPRSPQARPADLPEEQPASRANGSGSEQEILDLLSQSRLSTPVSQNPQSQLVRSRLLLWFMWRTVPGS